MHVELTDREREFVGWARVAHLATIDGRGRPHVVPICPVLDAEQILFATDEESAKVRNLRVNPHVALSFDDYSEDWRVGLRGILVRGSARVLDHGPEWVRVRGLLYGKFGQYEPTAAIEPGRTVIVEVAIEEVSDGGL
jgi:nitroimidazol reductase NimA-like FMN-containing flavoprotein (pyridoxamine 5'-phosphate oxidase superfamily)